MDVAVGSFVQWRDAESRLFFRSREATTPAIGEATPPEARLRIARAEIFRGAGHPVVAGREFSADDAKRWRSTVRASAGRVFSNGDAVKNRR